VTRPSRLEHDVVNRWLELHPLWILEDGHLIGDVHTKDYPGAVALLQAQVPLAQGLDHHPTATVSYRELRLDLWTHDREGLTQLDLDYAEGFETLLEGYANLLS
jgi:4a-hydroxytetrahydrobiopterin dehydratase